MGRLFWTVLIPIGAFVLGLAGALLVRLGLREVREDRARRLFRPQRERLEARFITALAQTDLLEGLRWDDASWQDEIVWARDRQTRRLLALIAVRFTSDPFFDAPDLPPRHATALFEYRNGRWLAEGRRLDEVRPHEVLLRHQRFLPVTTTQRRS